MFITEHTHTIILNPRILSVNKNEKYQMCNLTPPPPPRSLPGWPAINCQLSRNQLKYLWTRSLGVLKIQRKNSLHLIFTLNLSSHYLISVFDNTNTLFQRGKYLTLIFGCANIVCCLLYWQTSPLALLGPTPI